MGLPTFRPISVQVFPGRELASLRVQRLFHSAPREYDRRLRRIHVLGRVARLREVFHEMDGEVGEVGQIQAVQPDHRARAVLTMIVPVPGGGQDHIASGHLNALAVDGCEAALAFDDEAHGKSRVTVRPGCLIGHYQLETSIDGIGREGCI